MKIRDFRQHEAQLTFGVRSAALIIGQKGLLTLYDSKKDMYVIPGGAIRVGETTEKAALREVYEEIGIAINIQDLIVIVENNFKQNDQIFHNIEFYYRCKISCEYDENDLAGDTGLAMKWLPLSRLGEFNLKPSFLQNEKFDSASLKHLIIED